MDYSVFVRHVDESLFVPEGTNTSVVEIISEEHNEADALESLQYLHSVAHVFQYMQNPAHELIRCGPCLHSYIAESNTALIRMP